jgi:hypothetical protein
MLYFHLINSFPSEDASASVLDWYSNVNKASLLRSRAFCFRLIGEITLLLY